MSQKQLPRHFAATLDDATILHLTIRRPSRAESQAADMASSVVFNSGIRAGLPTQRRQIALLAESGQWTSDHEARMESYRLNAIDAENKLKATDLTQDDRDQFSKDRVQNTIAYRQLEAEFRDMLQHTCENKATIEYRNYIIACVIEYAATDADGAPVNGDKKIKQGNGFVMPRFWNSIEDLAQETDNSLLQRVLYEYSMFAAGLPSEWDAMNAVNVAVKTDAAPPAVDAAQAATAQPESVKPADPSVVAPDATTAQA